MCTMAFYTTEKALDALFGDDFDSGGESDTDEDSSSLLPREVDQGWIEAEAEGGAGEKVED